MSNEEIKKSLTAAGAGVETAIKSLQSISGGLNHFLSDLVLQSISALTDQERKIKMLKEFIELESK